MCILKIFLILLILILLLYKVFYGDTNNIQRRFILFLVFCIGARSLLAMISKNINPKYLPYMAIITIPIGIGFMYTFFRSEKGTKRQMKTYNGDIWWSNLRIVHSLIYLAFSFTALLAINEKYRKDNKAWVFLVVDVLIGLIAFLNYHCNAGNFNKL